MQQTGVISFAFLTNFHAINSENLCVFVKKIYLTL